MAICSEDRIADLDRECEAVLETLLPHVDDLDCSLSAEHSDGTFTLSLNIGMDLPIDGATTPRREVERLLETMLAEVRGAL